MHNHAPQGYSCPFCAIAKQSAPESEMFAPTDVLYQDASVLALLGAFQWPNHPGNVVVLPCEHFENIYDLPPHLACPIHDLSRAIALAMKAAWACDGVSTRQHNEPAGNQDVWHYHQHVTPRYEGDNFYASYVGGKALMPVERRAEQAAKLRVHLAGWSPADA
jgi:histidine triad (HIT) family protein